MGTISMVSSIASADGSSAGTSALISANALRKASEETAPVVVDCGGSSTAEFSIGISNSEISNSWGAADAGAGLAGATSLTLLFSVGGVCGCAGGAASVAAPCSRSEAHSSDKSTSCTGLLDSEGFGGGGTP